MNAYVVTGYWDGGYAVGDKRRPVSDVIATGWVGTPDNVNLFNNLDEISSDDADFITSPIINNSQGPATFGLGATLAVGTYSSRIRARRTESTGEIRLLLLDASNVVQGTSAWQALTNAWAPYTLSVITTGGATRARLEVQ